MPPVSTKPKEEESQLQQMVPVKAEPSGPFVLRQDFFVNEAGTNASIQFAYGDLKLRVGGSYFSYYDQPAADACLF